MSNVYVYCTRCGGQLSDGHQALAVETDAPPLCSECITELVEGLSEAIEGAFQSFGRGLISTVEQLHETERSRNDE
jgi:hypothetical protein